MRGSRRQTVRCLACGELVFVLPVSPYAPATAPSPTPRTHWTIWRLPILAGSFTLLLVVAVYGVILVQFRDLPTPRTTLSLTEQIESNLVAGREALRQRDFTEAEKLLRAARNGYQQQRDAIPASQGRRLIQLHRQAELLASRLPDAFELMLQRWKMLEQNELEKVFADVRGKAVFFDLELRREAAGKYHYERRLGAELPTLELHDLKLLNRLPLQNASQRVVFGARLAGLRRDAQNRFVVSFDPESGVLVTDEEVADVCCPPLDESLHVVLVRQRDWAIESP